MLEALSVRGVPYQVVCRPHFTVQRLFFTAKSEEGPVPRNARRSPDRGRCRSRLVGVGLRRPGAARFCARSCRIS